MVRALLPTAVSGMVERAQSFHSLATALLPTELATLPFAVPAFPVSRFSECPDHVVQLVLHPRQDAFFAESDDDRVPLVE